MKKITAVTAGAVLIVCGAVYILGVLGIADINVSFDGWWTLFIIIPSIGGLVSSRDKIGNLICLMAGVLLLLASRNVIGYDMILNLIVPVIIILLGVKLTAKHTVSSEKNKNECAEQVSEANTVIFGEKVIDCGDEEFTVGKIGAVFGGAKCNLANARIKDGSRLNLMCIFGGANIIVPGNVNVKINTFCLFGGISDKRTIQDIGTERVTLNINGFCLFGGADIK